MPEKVEIFISQAVADSPVTKEFVNLLESGIGVSPQIIFCTLNKGQGIRPGAEFKSSIRENLDEATTVIALISENYYNSPFCMCELGGTWLQAKDFIPILIPPIRFIDLKAVLVGLQALRIHVSEDLDELRDELAERLKFQPLPTPRWNEKRGEFLSILPEKIKLIPPSPIVQREQLEKCDEILSEYQESLNETQKENIYLKELNSKLKKAKNADEVNSIIREGLDSVDIFEALVADVTEQFNSLDSATIETLFAAQRGDDYFPNRPYSNHSWDEIQIALDYKEVELNSEENGIHPNSDNPDVRKAIEFLSELENWLEENALEEFYEYYSNKYNGHEPDLSNRSFWDRHLL